MLLHRVTALGRAILLVGGLALAAPGSGARAEQAHLPEQKRSALREQSTIRSRDALPADDMKGGEQVELVSIELRSVHRPADAGSSPATARSAPSDCLTADALRWCDVVQCRRLSGALLLGFATPPPAYC